MDYCRNCNQFLEPNWNSCPNCSTLIRHVSTNNHQSIHPSQIRVQDSVVMGNVSNTSITNVQQVQAIKQIVVPEGPVQIDYFGMIRYTRFSYNVLSFIAFFVVIVFWLPNSSGTMTTVIHYILGYAVLETVVMNFLFSQKKQRRAELMREIQQ
ncbi:MAG: hypothetical protein QF440_07255 [Candidatus Thalassarchaeaceae archaeon]|nr:hypothetical protein [Candidatus Thalassarchaeaceae archaeon]